jgi:hypothetical protein
VNVTERRVETVQLHGAMGDSIARLVIPASFVSTDAPDGGSSPRAG